MSGFSSAWLALREPADGRARAAPLLAKARGFAQARDGAILDLGCGAGATPRAFAASIPPARWRLFDRDEALLGEAARRHPGARTHVGDLSDLASLPLDGTCLVTASALFDLVSQTFVEALCERLSAGNIALYAALSVDGRVELDPPDAGDPAVLAAFSRHQTGEKGLGAALGPDAPNALKTALERRGYAVETAPSDWQLGLDEKELQAEFLRGMSHAAGETGFVAPAEGAGWLDRRLALIAEGKSRIIVGHVDLFAAP